MHWTRWSFVALCSAYLMIGAMAQGKRAPLPATAGLPAVFDQTETYRLWPERAPNATGDSVAETPTLTVYHPGRWANGTAVVIAPGGAYLGLSGTLEGAEPARWFTARGVTAFVLNYRTGRSGIPPTPFLDGARAVRFVRFHAAEFGIDPHRIGMMGFSAGGHLAATTTVEATPGDPAAADPIERVGSRPDFLVLVYPWLEGLQVQPDGRSPYCRMFTEAIGLACNPERYAAYVPLHRVADAMPPTFLYHTSDDGLVPVEGTIRFYLALRAHQVPAEMHVFQTGVHGTGLGGSDPSRAQWPTLLQEWMRTQLLFPAPAGGMNAGAKPAGSP